MNNIEKELLKQIRYEKEYDSVQLNCKVSKGVEEIIMCVVNDLKIEYDEACELLINLGAISNNN